MKVCEKCKLIHPTPSEYCPACGEHLSVPEKTDEYLKKFLEIDGKTLERFREIQKAAMKEAKNLEKKNGKVKAIGISGSARDKFDTAAESSNSEFLLGECLKELASLGADTELIPLRKYSIKPCKACYSTTNTQCHFYCSCYPKGTAAGDDMTNILYDKVLGADIIIFSTPVNNFKISSYMALFIDRCISLDGSLAPADPGAPKNKDLNIKHTKFVVLSADDGIPGSGFLKRFIGKVAGVIATGHEEGATMAITNLFMTLNHFGMLFSPWSNMYAMSSVLNATYKDKKIVTASAYVEDARRVARNAMNAARLLRKFDKLDWKYDYSSN